MKGIRYKKGLLKRCFSLLLILAVVWSGVSAPVISFAESLSGTQEGAAVPEGQSEPQGQNGATGETVPQGESGTQGQNTEEIQATQSGGRDVTNLLLKDDNLKAIILQDGQELNNNTAIDPKKPLNVVLSFKVPGKNDFAEGTDSSNFVKQGDCAKFKIAEGLDLSEASAWKNLYFTDTTENKKIKVGEFQFITQEVAGKKTVFLSVLFTANKDVNVLNETYDDINIFERYKDISVNCSASFKLENLNNSQTPGETGQTITILDKDYTFTIAPPTKVTLKKTGRVIIDDPSNRAIEWTLDITGDPDGCELVDELSEVGEYVDGSFKITYSDKTVSETPTYDKPTKKLSYTFSKEKLQGLKSPVQVSFQTELTGKEFRAGWEKAFYPENKLTKKENTAKLIKTEGGEQKEKAVAKATVEWGPVWVTKKGEAVFDKDTQQHYIDWTITVNEKEKAVLENVVITDVLRQGWHEMTGTLYKQEFVEASLTIYDKEGHRVGDEIKYKDSNGVIQDESENKVKIDNTVTDVHGRAAVAFTFPKIEKLEGKAVLKLKSKVDRGNNLSFEQFMGRDNRFYNDVKVTWENNPDKLPAIATANVGIGQRALTKSVAQDGIFATARVKNEHLKTYIKPVTTWNIKVQGAEITGSAVYDMLIFDSTVKREDIVNNSLTLEGGSKEVDGIEIKDFVPFEINGRIRYYQYIERSFYSKNTDLEAEAIPLYKGGKHVGDLLKVSGFQDKEDTSFTFQTRLRDPWLLVNPKEDIFTDEGASHTATNTVYIAKNSRIFDTHTDYPRYISRMLEKETLTAAQGAAFIKENKSEFVNSNIISETDLNGSSFNHARRSILYRLSVNADKIQEMGALTVKDELPTGWELKNYWIFRGESEIAYSSAPEITADTEQNVEKTLKEKSYARVKATGAVILQGRGTDNTSSDDVKVSVKEGEPLSFNFPDIKDAYVILIEAGPTAETLSEYMKDSGKIRDVVNKASLYLDSLNNQRIEKTQTTSVNLKQEIISKAYIYDPNKPGELKWYIDYITDGKSNKDDKLIIEDTLKKGIAVRFDSEGNLLYREYKIVELGFDAEGKPTETELNLVDLKDYISYKKVQETGESEKEVLTFKVPNPIKSYRFYYITDITGKKGEEVENTVVLKKKGEKIAEHAPKKKYKILEIDASAKATRIATLEIIKVDSEDNKALAGAKFTLKKNDGSFEQPITTDSNGRAKIKNLAPGDYILVETKAPEGYKLNNKKYKVTVTNNGSANVVKVDGETGILQVENTKDPTTPPAPPEKPDTPPVTPPGTPDTPPVTPPGNPFIPPADTVPDDPVPLPPTYPFDEIPDPNDPGSPDTIMVVDEDDTPLGIYEKKENPDGTFDYVVVDDKVPLDHIPKTGDRSYPIYFGFLFLLTIPVFMKKRKEL